MVESLFDASVGETTPRLGHDEKELPSNQPQLVYDHTSDFVSHGLGSVKPGDVESEAVSMTGEGRGGVPDSLDRNRSHPRRSPRPNTTSRHRITSGRPLQSPPTAYHGVRSSENIHGMAGSSHYPPSYNQPAVYGQHLMSPVHIPYTYQQYHPSVPDSNIMHHTSYPHLMQHPPTVYNYQQHSPGNGSPHHSGGPSVYPRHPVNPSSPHTSFPPGQNSSQSSSYATGQFQTLRYPTPLTPQYNYHPHSYPSSPVYPTPFTPSPYGHHYPSTVEPDRPPGPWYYFSPAPSPHQYESSSYTGHYSVPYQPGIGHHENSPSSPTTSGLYAPSPPGPHPLSSASGQAASSSSPITPGVGSSDANNAGSPGNSRFSTTEKPLVRRSYHPNPPPHRSDWVMWAGNVPSDATNEEVLHFFNQPQDTTSSGVLSVFLISRSCCTFVNFETEAQLQQSIQRFNGKPLRPGDSRCPRLVCRVRRKDDDLKAGVGGQRGMGVHTRWVKDQKAKAEMEEPSHGMPTPQSPISEPSPPDMSSSLLSAGEGYKQDEYSGTDRSAKYSRSSSSYASTNSSILTRHFPKRYFILKSLSQYDLDLSVEKGLWATQRHNEGILDQAYRTSQDVFLIFSVNKSGEFYGYARMAGPVRQGEHRVSWATRTDSLSSRSSLSPASGRGVISSPDLSSSPTRPSQSLSQGSTFFSPGSSRVLQESPLPLNTKDISRRPELAEHARSHPHAPPSASTLEMARTAPGEVGPPRSKVSPQVMKFSLDQQLLRHAPSPRSTFGGDFELDPAAPIRAMRSPAGSHSSEAQEWCGVLEVVAEEEEKDKEASPGGEKDGGGGGDEESWGESFKIEWLCREKLPFHRTRHLRNPWNHDREVKVSRDGTELEPTVGQRMLDEWMSLSEAQAVITPAKTASFLRRGTKQNPSVGMENSKKNKGINTEGG